MSKSVKLRLAPVFGLTLGGLGLNGAGRLLAPKVTRFEHVKCGLLSSKLGYQKLVFSQLPIELYLRDCYQYSFNPF
jgi:hypothetical protein